MSDLKAPYPWAGGKSAIVPELNARFGAVVNRVDAFCGSAAWMLGTPFSASVTETINDVNGDIINTYRAIVAAPDEVAYWCDRPVCEVDLVARRIALKRNLPELAARLYADADYYDAKAAGYFLYCMASQIGGDIYADGPWVVEDGMLIEKPRGKGVKKKMPGLNSGERNPFKGTEAARRADAGVTKGLPTISQSGYGNNNGVLQDMRRQNTLLLTMQRIAERMRYVRRVCGDWRRVLTPSITTAFGVTAVLLDPPYPTDLHNMAYGTDNEHSIWYDAAKWAIDNGDNKLLRIAICGYTTPEIDALFPATWERFRWQTNGGYGNQGNGRGRENSKRECVWFSPHCDRQEQMTLL